MSDREIIDAEKRKTQIVIIVCVTLAIAFAVCAPSIGTWLHGALVTAGR